MIQNYAEYEMTEKERVLFLGVGYMAAAGIVFLFYHSFILSALCGFLVIRMKPYYASWRAQQRRRKLQHQFKDLLYSLSASFTAGRQNRLRRQKRL